MLTRRTSPLGTKDGPRPAGLARIRLRRTAVLVAAGLALFNVAGRKDIGGGGKRGPKAVTGGQSAAAQPSAAQASAAPTVLSKTLALDALINALAINQTPAAEKTLEQIVTGEIPFGGHAKQASQAAMLVFALRPTPEGDAFLLRIFSDADEAIRPGDTTVYPAADLREDTAHVLAKVGTASLRLSLAKLYAQSSTPPAVRSAIERIIKTPAPANFAAQVEVFRSAEAPDLLKSKLQKILIEKNEGAMKAALKLATDASKGAEGGLPFSPAGGSPGAANPAAMMASLASLMGSSQAGAAKSPSGASQPNAANLPPGMAQVLAEFQKRSKAGNAAAGRATGAPPPTPAVMFLDLMGEMQSKVPIDPGLVAHDLWNAEFVETIAKSSADESVGSVALVNALASLPTKLAREKLKDLLHKERTKGPQDFGKVETVTSDAPATSPPAGGTHNRRTGKNKKDDEGGFGKKAGRGPMSGISGLGMQNQAKSQTKQEVTEFGTNWYDPGSLVVLKMVVPYAERPPEKPGHHAMHQQQQQRRMTPLMEKRMHEKEEKQKATEATYEWRDAIEKSIRQWDDRLAEVAEAPPEPQGASEKTPAGEDQDAAKTTKSASSKSATKSATKSASTSTGSKSTSAVAAVQPTPAVAMPFALQPGGTIAKEYHLRWPQDLAASFGSSAPSPDPLSVDYVRLQITGQASKALSHYRTAITALAGAKPKVPPKVAQRRLENGSWLDTIQKDQTGRRTRSVDVLVTKEQSDDDSKKSKESELTVEILVVEIETPGPETTPGTSKKDSPETTSTTPP